MANKRSTIDVHATAEKPYVVQEQHANGRWTDVRAQFSPLGARQLATYLWRQEPSRAYRVWCGPDRATLYVWRPLATWSTEDKLRYVRSRVIAQDALGRHPNKRLSLWPLSITEALNAVMSGSPPSAPSLTDEEQEQLTWILAHRKLAAVRKLLSQPGSLAVSPSPPKGSKRARTSRT